MHPFSPHAPSTAARHNTTPAPAPARPRGRAYSPSGPATLKGRMLIPADPLDVLAAEIRAKVPLSGDPASAHVAAEELKLRRPRRPAARRAGFRTPPASR
ncbi:MAG: hypothetical protein AAGC46_05955 [Solirubrobacteraceae bacterium]|nr:hypothetical protein [Patulibacter sp.]